MTISERCFLVGCPRSGTTFLQSLLAAHPQIHSFPESHFFASLLERRKRWHKILRMSSSQTHARLQDFLKELAREELYNRLSPKAIFEWQHTNEFISILDFLTEEENKEIWVEKTPRHLHHIDKIQKLIPTAKFIHITREGRDVVASMYDVTHKYPEIWNGDRDIDTCITRWITDLRITQNYSKKNNHFVIDYAQLTEHIQTQLEELCDFLSIEFDAMMLNNYRTVAQNVSLISEPWKIPNRGHIQNSKSQKFFEVFNEEQRDYIDKKISQLQ